MSVDGKGDEMSKLGIERCSVGNMFLGEDRRGRECWKNANDNKMYYVNPSPSKKSKYCIFTFDEVAQISYLMRNNRKMRRALMDVMKSLTSYMNAFKNKQICLRQLPDPAAGGGFFAEEVLEMIPLVLRQQRARIKKNDARLAAYREKYTPKESHLHTLVPYSEFLEILEDFKIDKALLTIFPDLNPTLSKGKPIGFEPIVTIGTDRTEVMSPQQAIWKVFRECVCEFRWVTGKNADVRRLILECMEKLNIQEPVMISLKHVEQMIGVIKNNPFHKTKLATYNAFLPIYAANSSFLLSNYHKVAMHCLLPIYDTAKINDDMINVWMARPFLASGWISQFFEDNAWKTILFDCMKSLMEDDKWELLEPMLRPLVYANKSSMGLEVNVKQIEDKPQLADLKKLTFEVSNTPYVSNQFSMNRKTRNKLKPKYFLVRKDLLEKSSLDDLTTFDKFYSKHKNAGLVIRWFSCEPDSSEHFVLYEDALDILLLLMQRKYNVRRDQIEGTMRKASTQSDDTTKITALYDFASWFRKFQIDGNMVTITQDPTFKHTSQAFIENPSNPIYFLDDNGEEVMTGTDASFHSFQSLICGRVWNDQQNKHFLRFKSRFCQLLVDLYGEPGCIKVTKNSTVDESIQQLLLEFDLNEFSTQIPDYLYKNYKTTDKIARNIIWDKCRQMGLDDETLYSHKEWPVPNVRIMFLKHYLTAFFAGEGNDTQNVVQSRLWKKIVDMCKHAKQMEDTDEKPEQEPSKVEKTSKNPQTTGNSPNDTSTRPSKESKLCYKGTGKAVNKANTGSDGSRANEPKKLKRKKKKNSKKEKKTMKYKQKAEEEQVCTKCTENGVALLNARELLKKIEISAKYNEKKAGKAEKVEANLKNMMLNMKELEDEIENLKEDLNGFDEKKEQLKEQHKKISKEIGNLEEQMERDEQKSQEAYQRHSRIEVRFEEVQLELVKRQSEQEAMELQGKRTRNPDPSPSSEEPSTFHVPFAPFLPTTDDPDQARNPKWVLKQWKQMRTDFKNDEMVDEEREMIEKLLSKSEDLELDVRNLVEYEMHQFEATCRIYLRNIDLNILKIEKTEDISNLRPLTNYPSLSKEFQSVYEKYMGNNN